jgi:HAD superfamily hydrolase (TIGR01509 family)
MIRALLFDFDGVIVDSEWIMYQVWDELFQEHECPLPIDLWLDGVGAEDAFDPAEYLQSYVGEGLDPAQLRAGAWQEIHRRMDRAQLRPGVRRLLREAHARGLRLAVASSGPRDWVERYLAHFGIRGLFHSVVCREDVQQVKPAPDVFLAAVRALGVTPEESLAIEDSPHGAAAAQAAGVSCIVAPSRITEADEFEGADLVVPSPAAISVDDIVAMGGLAPAAAPPDAGLPEETGH